MLLFFLLFLLSDLKRPLSLLMVVHLQVIHLLCQAFFYGELVLLYKILVIVDRELLIEDLPPVLVEFPVDPLRLSDLEPLLILLAARLSHKLHNFHGERDPKE